MFIANSHRIARLFPNPDVMGDREFENYFTMMSKKWTYLSIGSALSLLISGSAAIDVSIRNDEFNKFWFIPLFGTFASTFLSGYLAYTYYDIFRNPHKYLDLVQKINQAPITPQNHYLPSTGGMNSLETPQQAAPATIELEMLPVPQKNIDINLETFPGTINIDP